MPIGVLLFLAWMALEAVVVLAMIVWGFENKQWKDMEEPKYRMLIDHEPQPWPGRGKPYSKADRDAKPAPDSHVGGRA